MASGSQLAHPLDVAAPLPCTVCYVSWVARACQSSCILQALGAYCMLCFARRDDVLLHLKLKMSSHLMDRLASADDVPCLQCRCPRSQA